VHTGDGQNIPPPLTWAGIPKEARSLALLCEDPDAPGSEPFVHWLFANLDPTEAGTAMSFDAGSPPGLVEGRNGFGRLGYAGPEPPRGHGTHHYHFRLYALDSPLRLMEGFSKADLLGEIKGHTLATGEVIGIYSR
jgi:Raf kinase inhibitor-like YbhB/YbcL family protein